MTKRPIEVFDDAAAFRRAAAGKGKGRAKGTRTTTSEPGEGDRLGALERLAAFGMTPRFRAGIGFDCWNPRSGRATAPHATYAAALAAAESEVKDADG